jgi:Ca2+-binding RTX toxin-like protein
VAALALLPASALAAVIAGGPGNERLRGTNAPDVIDGNAGNDRILGLRGDDKLMGGPGDDRIVAGPGDDVSYGGPGNDVIFANLGQDTSYGGEGNDRLWALARGDVHPGPNGEVDQVGDTLDGGPGNDVFRTRDGEVDRITCGPGVDRAFLDQVDVIPDATAENPNGSCERVVRKAPRTRDGATEDAQGS